MTIKVSTLTKDAFGPITCFEVGDLIKSGGSASYLLAKSANGLCLVTKNGYVYTEIPRTDRFTYSNEEWTISNP